MELLAFLPNLQNLQRLSDYVDRPGRSGVIARARGDPHIVAAFFDSGANLIPPNGPHSGARSTTPNPEPRPFSQEIQDFWEKF